MVTPYSIKTGSATFNLSLSRFAHWLTKGLARSVARTQHADAGEPCQSVKGAHDCPKAVCIATRGEQ